MSNLVKRRLVGRSREQPIELDASYKQLQSTSQSSTTHSTVFMVSPILLMDLKIKMCKRTPKIQLPEDDDDPFNSSNDEEEYGSEEANSELC